MMLAKHFLKVQIEHIAFLLRTDCDEVIIIS